MARYYMHLHECGSVCEDLEGRELASPAVATAQAVRAARELMAAEVQAGQLCLSCYIAIHEEGGSEIARVRFSDAIRLSGV